MDEAEQRQQLRPGAETLVHGVRPDGGVGAQPGEQAAQRIMLLVDGMAGHQPAVLGVEDEDHPHQGRNQPSVEAVGTLARQGRRSAAAGARVRRDEAAQQFVEGGQHLPRKPGGDFRLRLAAFRQQRRKPRLFRADEKRVRAQQHFEGGEDGAARRLRHVGKAEGEVAGRLALRRMDEADALIGAEEAGAHAGFAQQTFEAGVAAGVPAAGVVGRLVEVGAVFLDADEHGPLGARIVFRRNRPGGGQQGAEFGEGDFERVAVRGGIREVGFAPAEPFGEDPAQVGGASADGAAFPFRGFLEQFAQFAPAGGDVAVGDDLRVGHDGGRNDEADRLDEAEPFQMGEDRAAAFAVGDFHWTAKPLHSPFRMRQDRVPAPLRRSRTRRRSIIACDGIARIRLLSAAPAFEYAKKIWQLRLRRLEHRRIFGEKNRNPPTILRHPRERACEENRETLASNDRDTPDSAQIRPITHRQHSVIPAKAGI